jgi:hypothetical protein
VGFQLKGWMMVVLAALGAAGIYGLLVWNRAYSDPALVELLGRLPEKDALTVHVDLASVRASGLASLLEGSAVEEELEYRRFVTETGFDWKTDLDAVTATRHKSEWYFFVRGRFDMDKLRNYALSRGGTCKNGFCDAPGATLGRRVSFYPLSSRVLALASSEAANAVFNIYRKPRELTWPGGIPEGSIWVSLNGSFLAGDPALPAGGRLFGKVLSETERATFGITGGLDGLALTMRAYSRSDADAVNVKTQLEGVTTEFRKYFDRIGQQAQTDDLSGLLLAGQFETAGREVRGRWPVSTALLKKLTAGEL